MIKINVKYFSPFTPIKNMLPKQSEKVEQKLVYKFLTQDSATVKDTFTKIPEIFY